MRWFPWLPMTPIRYGKQTQVQSREVVARWHRLVGKVLFKIVIVQVTRGEVPLRVFICTDTNRTAHQVMECYGGALFFLRLPRSGLKVDLPLILYPPGEPPDAGLQPDVLLNPRVEDIAWGVDTELEAAKAFAPGSP